MRGRGLVIITGIGVIEWSKKSCDPRYSSLSLLVNISGIGVASTRNHKVAWCKNASAHSFRSISQEHHQQGGSRRWKQFYIPLSLSLSLLGTIPHNKDHSNINRSRVSNTSKIGKAKRHCLHSVALFTKARTAATAVTASVTGKSPQQEWGKEWTGSSVHFFFFNTPLLPFFCLFHCWFHFLQQGLQQLQQWKSNRGRRTESTNYMSTRRRKWKGSLGRDCFKETRTGNEAKRTLGNDDDEGRWAELDLGKDGTVPHHSLTRIQSKRLE